MQPRFLPCSLWWQGSKIATWQDLDLLSGSPMWFPVCQGVQLQPHPLRQDHNRTPPSATPPTFIESNMSTEKITSCWYVQIKSWLQRHGLAHLVGHLCPARRTGFLRCHAPRDRHPFIASELWHKQKNELGVRNCKHTSEMLEHLVLIHPVITFHYLINLIIN